MADGNKQTDAEQEGEKLERRGSRVSHCLALTISVSLSLTLRLIISSFFFSHCASAEMGREGGGRLAGALTDLEREGGVCVSKVSEEWRGEGGGGRTWDSDQGLPGWACRDGSGGCTVRYHATIHYGERDL